jgi:hypothetical protein
MRGKDGAEPPSGKEISQWRGVRVNPQKLGKPARILAATTSFVSCGLSFVSCSDATLLGFAGYTPHHAGCMKTRFSGRRWKAAVVAVAFCLGLVVWFVGREPETIDWLKNPPSPRGLRLAFLGKWRPLVRNQLLRAKYWLLGAPRSVTIRGTILELDSPAALSNLVSSSAMFSNGVIAQAWVIRDAQSWAGFTNTGVRILSRPTVSVSDGMQARIAITERVSLGGRHEDVGIQLDLWPRLSGRTIDLTSFLVATEVVTNLVSTLPDAAFVPFVATNAVFGARVRLPAGSSLLLLSGRTNGHGKTIGVAVSPSGR